MSVSSSSIGQLEAGTDETPLAELIEVAEAGLVALREAAASFLAGPIVGHFIAGSDRLINWNAQVTDRLPLVLASGWYFVLRRGSRVQSETAGELV